MSYFPLCSPALARHWTARSLAYLPKSLCRKSSTLSDVWIACLPTLSLPCHSLTPSSSTQRAIQLEQRLRLLPGLIDKLQQGVKVADVGCG